MKKRYALLLQAWLLGVTAPTCWAMEPEEQRPAEHFCPITLQVMQDPVVASDGHSYEREAIQKHIQRSQEPISPMTGIPVNKESLIPNQALKSMIQDWKPGLQRGPSVLGNRSAEEISQQIRKEFKKNEALLGAAKDQHVVAFLGNTGAGKSTLVNLLSGKQLKVSADGEDYVLVDPSDSKAMPIGTEGGSETLYPKYIDVDGLRLFDLPGFNDTDGSERNLMNAAFIRKILLDAASVRLVLVVGQDQFTADRSASVKQMFHKLQQLFVIGQGGGIIDNSSVFVATKVTGSPDAEITESLVRRTNSKDKDELKNQLKFWRLRDRLACMYHPLRDSNNEGVKEQILKLIKNTETAEVRGINVSVLYPSDTQQDLERMFLQVFESAFNRKVNAPLTTLSDYDGAITYYTSKDFWKIFDAEICGEEDSIGLLKDFCINPYKTAFRKLEKENEGKRQSHIQYLRKKRETRIKDIEQRTEKRANEVISSLVPKKESDYFITFDFAYHKDFYDQVCGPIYITELATDLLEQEAVRRHYAGFISLHSHMQMRRWHQKFSETNDLVKKMSAMEERLKVLEAERAEEKLRITQAAEQREKQEQERLTQERLAKEAEERQKLKLAVEQREKQERERKEQEEKRRIQKEKEDSCALRQVRTEGCCKCNSRDENKYWFDTFRKSHFNYCTYCMGVIGGTEGRFKQVGCRCGACRK